MLFVPSNNLHMAAYEGSLLDFWNTKVAQQNLITHRARSLVTNAVAGVGCGQFRSWQRNANGGTLHWNYLSLGGAGSKLDGTAYDIFLCIGLSPIIVNIVQFCLTKLTKVELHLKPQHKLCT